MKTIEVELWLSKLLYLKICRLAQGTRLQINNNAVLTTT